MTEFRNIERELERFRWRLVIAFLFVLFCFGLLLSRFIWLQVVKHDQYSARAENNRISVQPIEPNRGIITDRNGVILARNYSAYTLEITPSKLNAPLDATLNAIAQIVEITPRDRRRFRRLMEESRSFESLPIRNQLSDVEVARFSAQQYRFPGVDIRARLFRQYPQGETASHVIGYIGRISQRDNERIEEMSEKNAAGETDYDPRRDANNYRGTEYIGKIGIEQSYETELHGLTGVEEVEVSAGGRAIRTLSTSQATPGNNLVLSLDIHLQRLGELLYGDRRGALVAIEPDTGDILAFVSMPTYDPNMFVEGIDTATWNELNNSPHKPLLNRPLRGAYPPGSTYKPFMALAALETGLRTAQWGMSDPGGFTLGNHTFRDDKVGGHGWVDMHKSIVESCDTYYYVLARDMGVDRMAEFMKPLGFGQITGIDIEGERSGILPSTEWKRKAYRKPAQQRWYEGETISLGIGQGYNNFTILQLAHATGILANGGVVMKPHLVKAVEDSISKQRRLTVPKESYRLPYKPEHIEIIKRAMVDVNKSGTSARAFAGTTYVAAGKTGTAQTYSLSKGEVYRHHALEEHKRDHALYMAFAPADKPRIALALIVENAGFGGQHAAPIARKMFDYYLTGKWPQELAEHAPPPSANPPADTPSVFVTGKTATIASTTTLPPTEGDPASAPIAANGAQASAPTATGVVSASAASSPDALPLGEQLARALSAAGASVATPVAASVAAATPASAPPAARTTPRTPRRSAP